MSASDIVVFKDGELEIEVNVAASDDTVWLNQSQMADLFDTSSDNISLHIKNIYLEMELEECSTTKDFSVVRKEGNRNVKRKLKFYNLDMIISVGYRVKSKRGIAFRKWASSILKDYMIKGYTLNEKKLNIPDHQHILEMLDSYRKLDSKLPLSSDVLLDFLMAYEKGLRILDQYDHHSIQVPDGIQDVYKLGYEECIDIVRETSFKDKGDHFAVERDDSFKSSIGTIYQTFGGIDLYPTLEGKAANLLYLITKNHSFIDGNKRIAAVIFLYFLKRNNTLYINGRQRISNETLATLTILIASSNPNEMESIVNLILVLIS